MPSLEGDRKSGTRQVTEHEGTIQLSGAAKCPEMDMLLQQIADSYLHAQ